MAAGFRWVADGGVGVFKIVNKSAWQQGEVWSGYFDFLMTIIPFNNWSKLRGRK